MSNDRRLSGLKNEVVRRVILSRRFWSLVAWLVSWLVDCFSRILLVVLLFRLLRYVASAR